MTITNKQNCQQAFEAEHVEAARRINILRAELAMQFNKAVRVSKGKDELVDWAAVGSMKALNGALATALHFAGVAEFQER